MSFWRKIAGLAVRGPDAADCPDCPAGLPGEDPAFSTAVVALGAKLARADGHVGAAEFEAFSDVFQSDEASRPNVRRLYNLARQTTRGFESYARRLAHRYRGCPQILEDVLDGLFYIAAADGAVSDEEMAYISRVAELFGFSELVFRRLKATHLGLGADDPYAVLGAPHDASDEQLRAAWKIALIEHHPDRARSRGLPQEFVEVAEAKAKAINAAFEAAMRERREMALVGAA
ncbi:MAG TPA: DnaJ family molecular chaperone [Phenylobacterium sp.]|nr:DnaJ family molecular chaperone [Phenylobacterium sp.]